MSPEDLLSLFRSNVEDTDENDPLWSDVEMYSYMDEAQKQFARETDYFMDASTPDPPAIGPRVRLPYIRTLKYIPIYSRLQ